MATILLMEPDPRRGAHLKELLTGAGYSCTLCGSISDGLSCLRSGCRTMTILNARLPWSGSTAFLRSLERMGLPVLFLAGDPANLEHLRAIYQANSNAVCENCTDNELLEAVRRLLETSPATLTLGDLSLNAENHCVSIRGGNEQALTQQEFALLQALMEAHGSAMTREQLLRTAWGYQSIGMTRTVDVHVQRLRKKLGSRYIETIHKLGYRLCTA